MLVLQIPANQTIWNVQVLQRMTLIFQAQVGSVIDTDIDIIITDADMVSDREISDTKKRYFTSVQPTSC
jgi:hypothetical protein